MLLLSVCIQTTQAQESLESIMSTYSIAGCRYWFDDATTAIQRIYKNGKVSIDVSQLEEGFHTLHYQILDDRGEVSPVRTAPFFRLSETDEQFKDYAIATVRYWFDKEYTPKEVNYTSGTSKIDVAALEEGFHTLHYQVIDSKGEASPSRTSSLFRISSEDEQFKDYTIAKVRYWFDKDYTPREVTYANGTSAIDVSALEEGFHTLHYQVVNTNSEASPSRIAPFFRLRSKDESFKDYSIQTLHYWFDNDVASMQTANYTSGQQVLNLSSLKEGAHTLCYQVLTNDGQASPARSADINRWIYDIYISRYAEYDESIVSADPLLATHADLKLHHATNDTNVRGHLTIDEGTELSLGKYVQTANWGTQTNNKFARTGEDYYHTTTLLNNGFVRADSVLVKQSVYRDRWHFLSLPFNANVSDIDAPIGTYWVLRSYDGDARAAGEMTNTWQNLKSDDKMEAGKGYILQLTKEGTDKTSCLTFKSVNDPQKNNIFTREDTDVTLEEHLAEFAHNRSWNLVGNPYPCFFDTRRMSQSGNIIVWNGNSYQAYSLSDDNYILMPFEAFFIQKPVNAEILTFSKEGRQHTHEAIDRASSRPLGVNGNRRILNFTLANTATVASDLQSDTIEYENLQFATPSDRSRVVINEQASMGYEADKDAPKFMEVRPQTTQLWSIEGGVQYAINERPLGDGTITFSIYAATDSEYSFTLENDAADVTVHDTETGTVWSLADGSYVFTATEGMHPARLVVSFGGEATAIAQVEAYDDGELKTMDGLLSFSFNKAKCIEVYAMDGRQLYSNHIASGSVMLSSGIYIVSINGKTTKLMVR